MNLLDVDSKVINDLASQQATLEIVDFDSNQANHFQKENVDANIISKAASVLKGIKNEAGSPTKIASRISQGVKSSMLSNGTMMVQYNPKTLKYQGHTSPQKNVKSEDGTKINTIPASSIIEVSFELVFHSKVEGDTSVKEKMNFMMNMLYEAPNKTVKFSWSNLQVQGQVTHFSGQYDMFDNTGNPISGSMNLTIQSVMSLSEVQKITDKIDSEKSEKMAAV